MSVGFEKGVSALGAAIERMYDRGQLGDEDMAALATALHDNLGPDAVVIAPSLADLAAKLIAQV